MAHTEPTTDTPLGAHSELREQLDALLDDRAASTAEANSRIGETAAQTALAAHSDTPGENPAPESGVATSPPPARVDHDAGSIAAHAASTRHIGEDGSISLTTPDNVEDLDAQLASLTESLLTEDARSAATPVAHVAMPATAAADASPMAPNDSLAAGPVADASSTGTHAAQHLAAPQHAASHTIDDVTKGQPTTDTFSAKTTAVKHVAAKAKEVASPVAAKAASAIVPGGTRALIVINKPLEGKSAALRDSLGWVGLWTLFNAACVWIFVAFFQKPPQLDIPHDAPQISSSDDSHDKKSGEHNDHGPSTVNDHSDSPRGEHAAKSVQTPSAGTHSKTETQTGSKTEAEHAGH